MTSSPLMNGEVWVAVLSRCPIFLRSFFWRLLSALAVIIWTILLPSDEREDRQWYQKGPFGKRIATGNPDFADMLPLAAFVHMMNNEGIRLMQANAEQEAGAVADAAAASMPTVRRTPQLKHSKGGHHAQGRCNIKGCTKHHTHSTYV